MLDLEELYNEFQVYLSLVTVQKSTSVFGNRKIEGLAEDGD